MTSAYFTAALEAPITAQAALLDIKQTIESLKQKRDSVLGLLEELKIDLSADFITNIKKEL